MASVSHRRDSNFLFQQRNVMRRYVDSEKIHEFTEFMSTIFRLSNALHELLAQINASIEILRKENWMDIVVDVRRMPCVATSWLNQTDVVTGRVPVRTLRACCHLTELKFKIFNESAVAIIIVLFLAKTNNDDERDTAISVYKRMSSRNGIKMSEFAFFLFADSAAAVAIRREFREREERNEKCVLKCWNDDCNLHSICVACRARSLI